MGLKELRIENKYSQEELASLCDLSTRTIQRIEKENKASCESIIVLAKVFKLDVKEFEKYLNTDEEIKQEEDSKYSTFFTYLQNDKKTIYFLFVNIFLIIINLATNYENLWFPYVLIGWGFPHFYKRYMDYKQL